MILELAQIDIKPGNETAFEEAVRTALPLFDGAQGCRDVQLRRSVENPARYFLMIQWETIEDHMVGFQKSPAFERWRELVGPHFAAGPDMQHARLVVGNE